MVNAPKRGLLKPPQITPLKAWPQRLPSAFAVCWPCGLLLFEASDLHASANWPDNGLKPVSVLAISVKSSTMGSETLIPIFDCSRPFSANVDCEPAKLRVVVNAWNSSPLGYSLLSGTPRL